MPSWACHRLHEKPDDLTTQPSGNCESARAGVIKPLKKYAPRPARTTGRNWRLCTSPHPAVAPKIAA